MGPIAARHRSGYGRADDALERAARADDHLRDQWVTTNPVAIGFGLIFLIIEIYCAYKTAANGRWVLFFIGFCFPLLWLIGAILGRKPAY